MNTALAILLAIFSFNALADVTFTWTNPTTDANGAVITPVEIAGLEVACGLVPGGYSLPGASTTPPWLNLTQTVTGSPPATTMTVPFNIAQNQVFCATRVYRVSRDTTGAIIVDGLGNPVMGLASTYSNEKSFNPNILTTIPLNATGDITVIVIQ